MAIATSNFVTYNQDPKFFDELEMIFRQGQNSLDYYRGDYQAKLRKGSVIDVSDELQMHVADQDGHSNVVYGQHTATEQSFTVQQGQEVAERVFDSDNIRSEFAPKEIVTSNGLHKLNEKMDTYRYQKLFDNARNILATVDLTTFTTNSAKGNAIEQALLDANETLDFTAKGNGTLDRKASFGRTTRRFLKDADKFTDATTESQNRIISGRIGMIDGTNLLRSNNLFANTTSFNVSAKENVTTGLKEFTVDNNGSGTINPPRPGDTFSNTINAVAETFTILTVKQVTLNVEYDITVDKVIGTQINDNATIAIAGRDIEYVPVAEGSPGQSVIQKDARFEFLRDIDTHSWLIRAFIMHDAFLSREMSRRLVIVPIKFRSIV